MTYPPENTRYILLGFAVFFLCIFPYCAVGKFPDTKNFNSRFQILLPLALSTIVYFAVSFITRMSLMQKRLFPIVIWIIIFSFGILKCRQQFRFLQDHFYQLAAIEIMKKSSDLKQNSTFIIENNLKPVLMYNRTLSFYEYTGWLKKAFNDTSRFMIESDRLEDLKGNLTTQIYSYYNFSSWKRQRTLKVVLDINKGFTFKPAKMTYQYLFNRAGFLAESQKMIQFKVEPSKIQI